MLTITSTQFDKLRSLFFEISPTLESPFQRERTIALSLQVLDGGAAPTRSSPFRLPGHPSRYKQATQIRGLGSGLSRNLARCHRGDVVLVAAGLIHLFVMQMIFKFSTVELPRSTTCSCPFRLPGHPLRHQQRGILISYKQTLLSLRCKSSSE